MKVFISYAREDWEIAERVWSDLKQAGIDAWIDRKELKPGQRWKAEISRAIKESSHFIALLSTRSVSKQGFFQTELKKASDVLDEMPEHDIYFIPVRIDDCKPNHEKLMEIQWADLFPSYQEGLKQILSVLAPDSVETAQPRNIPEEPEEFVPIINTGMEEMPVPPPKDRKPEYQLRKNPVIADDPVKTFELNDEWKPLEYVENDFEDNGDGIISDYATGLMWQKSGSPNYKYYKDVPTYIKVLNDNKFAGFDDWRLPTVNELVSLLEPEKQSNDLFINPIFESEQNICWTSDQRTSGGAWDVSFGYGIVACFDYNLYVRAVRSI